MQVLVDRRINDELRIPVSFAVVRGVTVEESSPALDALVEDVIAQIRGEWAGQEVAEDPRIQGFFDLHRAVAAASRDRVPGPLGLVQFILRRRRFPRINTLVDVYNSVSASTCLALGAHDLSKITGKVRFGFTSGTERFRPLGSSSDMVQVRPGEYAYMDDEDILCRLEVLQCDKTKITSTTTDVLLIVQGNPSVAPNVVPDTMVRLVQLVEQHCGGGGVMITPEVYDG